MSEGCATYRHFSAEGSKGLHFPEDSVYADFLVVAPFDPTSTKMTSNII